MRTIKKLLIYSTIIGATIAAIMVVFGFIYQDKIISSVQTELNKHLNAEIKVKTIELSFISNFPHATVALKNVIGFESKNYSPHPDTLFVFNDFELSFNVLEIINGNYSLNEINAQNGFANLEVGKNGEQNFLIFMSESESSSSFSLNLKKVKLTNVEVGYKDYRETDGYRVFFKNTIAKGSFSETIINTSLYGGVVIKQLELENTPYLTNEKAKVDIGLEINLETGSFQISRGYLTLRENYKFEVKGNTNAKMFQYTFDARNLKIKHARSLVPKKHLDVLKDYDIDGKLNMFVKVKRLVNEKYPSISGNFDISNGNFLYEITGQSVAIKTINGSFDLGKYAAAKSAKVNVSDFSLVTKEANAIGSFYLSNFKSPHYKIKTNGKADLNEISKLVDLGAHFQMQGLADFNLDIEGRINKIESITSNDIKSIHGKGNINLKEAAFNIKGLPEISKVSSKIAVNQNEVLFTDFSALVAGSSTEGNVKLNHWLDYVLKKSKRLDITGNVSTVKFDVANWLTKTPGERKKIKVEEHILPAYLSFVGKVEIGVFKNDKTILNNVAAEINYMPQRLKVTNARFDGVKGKVLINAKLNEWTNGLEFKGDANIQKVDLALLLKTYDNFGLTTITSDQIKGDFYADLEFQFTANSSFDVNPSSVTVNGDLMLLNGEIIENKLLYNIPKEIESNKIIDLFVNLDLFEKRLHHIKFDTISNHLIVKNKVVTIPRMAIKSTALNIGVKGTHSFDNDMDYYLNFNLNSVLGKKEPIKNEYGFIADDETGNRNMYLHLYTKKGEVVVDVDKFGSKKLIDLSDVEEVSVAKSILKEEFGMFEKDTSIVVEEKEEVFEYDVDLGEFSEEESKSIKPEKEQSSMPDAGIIDKTKNAIKAKKKNKKKEADFEEWNFDDDDF